MDGVGVKTSCGLGLWAAESRGLETGRGNWPRHGVKERAGRHAVSCATVKFNPSFHHTSESLLSSPYVVQQLRIESNSSSNLYHKGRPTTN